MTDPVADIVRAAAGRLSTDRTPTLSQDVELVLRMRDSPTGPETYVLDPISLGSLIVAVATLAWTIHNDRKNRATETPPEILARTLRVRLRTEHVTDSPDHDRIIDVVVEETLRLGSALEHEH